MTRIGFTGTQRGMTERQMTSLVELVARLGLDEVDHGGCCGADEEFHEIMRAGGARIVVHRASGVADYKIAECLGAAEYRDPLPPLDRNWNIASETQALIATPGEPDEVLRSGTWSTIRRARKLGRRIYIICPDGSIKEEEPNAQG